MTFANVGTLGVKPGARDQLIDILTRPNPELVAAAGCLLYEVGANESEPDTVYVAELWESAEAHQASLQLDSVRAAIAEAMPLLSGQVGGWQFDVIGSPLRSSIETMLGAGGTRRPEMAFATMCRALNQQVSSRCPTPGTGVGAGTGSDGQK